MPEPRTEDRRRVRTRKALLRAGLVLFAERSVDGVTIDDIVQAAEVAKGSFYNHFPDKDALAIAIAEAVRLGVEDLVAEVNEGVADPAERVARALCVLVRQAHHDPLPVRARLRLFQGASVPDAPTDRGVRADVRAGLEAGRFSDLTPENGVLLAVGVVQIAVTRVLALDAPAAPSVLANDLALGLLRGLGLGAAEARAIAAAAAADIFSRRPSPRSDTLD